MSSTKYVTAFDTVVNLDSSKGTKWGSRNDLSLRCILLTRYVDCGNIVALVPFPVRATGV